MAQIGYPACTLRPHLLGHTKGHTKDAWTRVGTIIVKDGLIETHTITQEREPNRLWQNGRGTRKGHKIPLFDPSDLNERELTQEAVHGSAPVVLPTQFLRRP